MMRVHVDSIRETVLHKVYISPQGQRCDMVFDTALLCPSCGLEFVHIIEERAFDRRVACYNCGENFISPKPIDGNAA